jgi:hypothetical protein
MRNKTAPEEDDVLAELIKYGRPTTVEAMMVWEKEIMSECWRTSIPCPVLKNDKDV